MNFYIDRSIEILERTPVVLQELLSGLSHEWTQHNEGADTWSPYDIVGHLIHGEKTDWIPRMQLILSDNADKRFEPFDRFAQFSNSKGKTLAQLLAEFSDLRKNSVAQLHAANIQSADLSKTGIHPAFKAVTLSELLATWTVHDLNHIAQIVRVMAFQYKEAVGPWKEYLGILKKA